MKNPFASAMKAARLMQKGRPLSAALAMHGALSPSPKPAKRKPAAKRTPKPTPPARPLPGSFIDGLFESKHGTIRYKLYTPTGSARRRMPIVVMLHGCSQSAGDFATGTGMNQLADERGVIMLYPEQSRSANMARCWNWHRPGDQLRGKGEPALIAGLTRHAIALARADPTRVYIAGISAGGVAAAIIGQAYPELFVAVGIHSALTRGDVSTVSGALAAMRGRSTSQTLTGRTPRPRPTIVFHGDADTVVHPPTPMASYRCSNGRPMVRWSASPNKAHRRAVAPSPAPNIVTERATSCSKTGPSMAAATPGQAARASPPTPIQPAPTPRAQCCASSSPVGASRCARRHPDTTERRPARRVAPS